MPNVISRRRDQNSGKFSFCPKAIKLFPTNQMKYPKVDQLNQGPYSKVYIATDCILWTDFGPFDFARIDWLLMGGVSKAKKALGILFIL